MVQNIIALIPAHNEQDCIGDAIRSVMQQSRKPDRLVVVSDNSTDRTVEIAIDSGVEVFETVGNADRKSGALNQAIEKLEADDETFILIVDADTRLSSGWIATAIEQFQNENVGGCGRDFSGRSPERYPG